MSPQEWITTAKIYDVTYNTYTEAQLISAYEANAFQFAQILGPRLFATRLLNGTINATLSTAQIRANAAGSPIINGSSQVGFRPTRGFK